MKQFIDRVDAWGEALKRREFRFPSDLTAGIVFALVGIFMLLAMPSQITVTGGDCQVDGNRVVVTQAGEYIVTIR